MSRLQAIIDWQESIKKQDGSASIKSNGNNTDSAIRKKPKFHLLLTQKFEQSEMSEIFFGRYMKYVYLRSFTIILFRFCIMLFALIVIPLSLVELTEQKFLQVLLGLMRFFTFGCLIIYSVANFVSQPQYNPYNTTTTFNNSYHSYGHQILKFDFKRWVLAVPIFVYAQILHQGIPSMTQPIKAKEWMKVFFGAVFISTIVLYLSLGVTMSLWFKGSIQETATLNFFFHSTPCYGLLHCFLPSLDVCSAYPLGVFTVSNNLFMLFTGSDSTQLHKHKYGKVMLIAIRLVYTVLPIIESLFITNLVFIVKYAGLLGLFICYFFPIALQL
ncbi:transmembrane protein 104 homolog [Dysidea avara]|uniref:transmembrane protein 104 homolog n=1 Tax=Dysidea avara TaxID=196820 RepID=UPI00331958A3